MGKLVYFILVIVGLYFYNEINNLKKNNLKENMSNTSKIDYEAIKNLGVIAKGLTKGGFKVPGDLIIDGLLKIRNKNGTMDIGPQNKGWAHIYTDRPKIAFNKKVWNVGIRPYQPYVNKSDQIKLEAGPGSWPVIKNQSKKWVHLTGNGKVILWPGGHNMYVR